MAGEAEAEAAAAPALARARTSFVGRAAAVAKVAALAGHYRLVTVTGPGGVGKTRLAGEVVRQVADRYADDVCVVELAAVEDPALVPLAVATALGVQQQSASDSVAGLVAAWLARQQLLLVLDNCEHLLDATAELCAQLLLAADDIRILATSREPLGLAEEARYRLPPLTVPGTAATVGAGSESPGPAASESEAVTLFVERARQVVPQLKLDGAAGPLVSRLVRRLDGTPLAIELAARVEALGLGPLLDLLDDRLRLLVSANRGVPARQRSLEATVDWSYRLLEADEQRVFRYLAVIPGPFTLAAAEAVAGPGTSFAVLRLVDCSLLTPPQPGPDGRSRYLMLETLRSFGRDRLRESAEEDAAAAALAAHVRHIAEQAGAGLADPGQEPQAARWLDAEDAAVHQGLTWFLDHDPPAALRTAVALAPWWVLRGRWIEGLALLQRALGRTGPATPGWYAAQVWVYELSSMGATDYPALVSQASAVIDALQPGPPSVDLVDAFLCRSGARRNSGGLDEARGDARAALDLARQIDYATGEAFALLLIGLACEYAGQADEALEWVRRAQQVDLRRVSARRARVVRYCLPLTLLASGHPAAAQERFEELLTEARAVGDQGLQADILVGLADIARRAGQLPQAGSYLRESARIALATGYSLRLVGLLHDAALQCAAAGRQAEAVTPWAAETVQRELADVADMAANAQDRAAALGAAEKVLGSPRFAAAGKRGAAMTLTAALEFAFLAVGEAAAPAKTAPPRTGGLLSARERELVALVAQGLSDAEIAAKLFISVGTVRTHLDRIKGKSGYRRRADLTRLALREGII